MKITKEKTYFLKPENLDVAALLESKGVKVSRIMADKYHYLLDSLHLRRVMWGKDKEEYLPVNYDILKSVLTSKHAGQVKRNLVLAGVLETDGVYHKGKKSLGYRFAPGYRGKFAGVEATQNSFVAKIKRICAERLEETLAKSPAYRHIFGTLQTLTIDAPAATEFVSAAVYPAKEAENALESRLYAIKRAAKAEWKAGLDEQGRFYTNFVQMARDVRQFCKLGGEDIWQADYSALQPSLLAMLYPADCPEKAEFVKVVESGFYKYLAERYTGNKGERFNLDIPEDKAEFKQLVFSNFVYCQNRVVSPMRDLFTAEFPILAGLIINAKTEDYSALPKQMQSLEAKLVLSIVVPRLIERFPGIPLLSIHDCLATTAKFLPAVKIEMEKSFKEFTGFSVGVKTEKVTR